MSNKPMLPLWMTDGSSVPREEATLHHTLTDAQRSLPPDVSNLRRFKEDDPKIVEVWV